MVQTVWRVHQEQRSVVWAQADYEMGVNQEVQEMQELVEFKRFIRKIQS
jgi:hypothetical protein